MLELLVVVAIIGIFTGVAVLSLGITGRDRQIQQEAFRLKSLLSLIREEALMQDRDFGVEFTATGYRFYAYDAARGLWLEPTGDNLLKAHALRKPLGLSLHVEGRQLTLAPAGTGQDGTGSGDGTAAGAGPDSGSGTAGAAALDGAVSADAAAADFGAGTDTPPGDGSGTPVRQVQPQVLILADGEITPFKAELFRDRNGPTFTLSAQVDGTFEISDDAQAASP